MRVLFTTTNWKGVYYCLIPLGWALQAAGHEVRVLCAAEQAEPVSRAGLTPVPLLADFDMMSVERMSLFAQAMRTPDGPRPAAHPVTGVPVAELADYDPDADEAAFRHGYHEVLGRNCDQAVGFVRRWRPDLVVHDLMSMEGVVAARFSGVPAVYHSPGMFGPLETGLHDPTDAMSRHGLPGWDRSHLDYFIDPTPAAVAPEAGAALRLTTRYLPYNGPGSVPAWLLEPPARPRVVLIWGNSASGIFGPALPALRHAVEAVTDLGAELLLTAAPEQVRALGQLPDSVRVLTDFPLRLLLDNAEAVIHQGSVNPMMTAAGLPQLALALTDDQLVMGQRFAAGGSGLFLPGLDATGAEVRTAVATLIGDPRLREAAAAVGAEAARRPPVSALVPALEQLARTGLLTAADLAPVLPDAPAPHDKAHDTARTNPR